jgi:hypothetical protein
MSHPHMKCLDLSLTCPDDDDDDDVKCFDALHVVNNALHLTRLTSLSINIVGTKDDSYEWDYELDRLRFMTNLTSLKFLIDEEYNDVLSIKDDKIFSSLTKLTNLMYRRDHSSNSGLMMLKNLKILSIYTIYNYHVTPSFIERLSHVNLFSFRGIVNNGWRDVMSYFRDNTSLYKEKLNRIRISQIHKFVEDGSEIILSFVRRR